MRLTLLSLLAALLLVACRPPSAVVLVEDPSGRASDADALRMGRSLDDLSEIPLQDGLPATVTFTHEAAGERAVFIEAVRGDDVLARTRIDVTFQIEDGTTFVARLAGACSPDEPSSCDDGSFCSGEETCDPVTWSCRAGPPPCELEAAACAVVQCVEETSACTAVPDHASCEPLVTEGGEVPSFCDVDAGCVATVACESDAECDDGAFCNGVESCFAGRCVPGVAPDVDDEEPCTLDACDEEADAVVHQPRPPGTLCTLDAGGAGICEDAACAASVCGDGVVDSRLGETCDDGNAHDDDLCSSTCARAVYTVTRYAGGSLCDGAAIDDTVIPEVRSLENGPDGALYLTHKEPSVVRRMDPLSGVVTRVAGIGIPGADPDGLPATEARLSSPTAATAHADGRVFIREQYPNRVRVIGADGVLRTVAGAPTGGTVDQADDARTVGIDEDGVMVVVGDELLLSQFFAGVVQRIDLSTPDEYPLDTVLGGGLDAYSLPTDGRDVDFNGLHDLTARADGIVLWTAHGDLENHVMSAQRNTTTGGWDVDAVAGNGSCAEPTAFPGAAATLGLCDPEFVAVGALGMEYCFTTLSHHVVCVDDAGVADIVAGDGSQNTSDLTVPATQSGLGQWVDALATDGQGRLYMNVVDPEYGGRLLRLSSVGGSLEAVGTGSVCGTGGDARDAHFGLPQHLAMTTSGELALSAFGTLYVVAASGVFDSLAISGGAEHFAWSPSGELAGASWDALLLIADDAGTPSLWELGGNGSDLGDGVPIDEARVDRARDLLWLDDDTIVYADEPQQKVRRATRDEGGAWTVDTVAGSGVPDALAGDGPALTTPLSFPFDIEKTPDGGLLIAQRDDPRVRRLTADGQLETVATMTAPVTAIATVPSGTAFVSVASHRLFALVADDDGVIPAGAMPVPVSGTGLNTWREGDASVVPLPSASRMVANADGDVFLVTSKEAASVFRLERTAP